MFTPLSLPIHFSSIFENPFILSRFILGEPSFCICSVKPSAFEGTADHFPRLSCVSRSPHSLRLGCLQFLTTYWVGKMLAQLFHNILWENLNKYYLQCLF